MATPEPTWRLVLTAARDLHRRQREFRLQDLIAEVQRLDPTRERGTIQPTVQGMTVNAGIGPPSPCGKPLRRVDRGLYEYIGEDVSGDQSEPASAHGGRVAERSSLLPRSSPTPTMHPSSDDIERHFTQYIAGRSPDGRYASFDYCYEHFQRARDSDELELLMEGDRLQLSCLHLGFYLASWGMLRGSGDLLQRSARDLVPVVEAIASEPVATWTVDADTLQDAAGEVLAAAGRIRRAFRVPASDILVTKTLLGVFGCVPAFDRYFKTGFGVSTFGLRSVERVGRFYADNREVLDQLTVDVLDFATGMDTTRRYPKSKIIDMVFFERGRELDAATRRAPSPLLAP
jgi:hypothetical protein